MKTMLMLCLAVCIATGAAARTTHTTATTVKTGIFKKLSRHAHRHHSAVEVFGRWLTRGTAYRCYGF